MKTNCRRAAKEDRKADWAVRKAEWRAQEKLRKARGEAPTTAAARWARPMPSRCCRGC